MNRAEWVGGIALGISVGNTLFIVILGRAIARLLRSDGDASEAGKR